MAEYELVTIWRVEAPLERVYAAVCEPLRWPEWWPDAQRVEQRERGAADGIGRVLRCTWQGRLPYSLHFDLLTTRVAPNLVVEGRVSGDLEGTGRCLFSQAGAVTTVRHEWRVRTTRLWMNLLSPFIRALFKLNHARAMQRGGEGLAHQLGARLLALEHCDLKATAGPKPGAGRWLAGLGAGLLAGVVATLAQIALWWLFAIPVLETLYRDTRLTAAVIMGESALHGQNLPHWKVWLIATIIHFALSIAYGLTLAGLLGHLRGHLSLLAGGVFGIVLYVVNLYGFTAIFPWFAVARDGITFFVHLVFGTSLAASYLAIRARRPFH